VNKQPASAMSGAEHISGKACRAEAAASGAGLFSNSGSSIDMTAFADHAAAPAMASSNCAGWVAGKVRSSRPSERATVSKSRELLAIDGLP